jgi:vacuolar-type H+-ATPase catalytic subunit A/Vma1
MKTKEEILDQVSFFITPTKKKQILVAMEEYATQCQEDMKDKKYTEEDIKKAIDMARMLSHVSCLEEGEHRLKYSNTEEAIIQSLNKQD